jgi:hypothetical protein
MTFYQIAEQMYIYSQRKIREENLRKSMHEGSPDLSIYDKNKEMFEEAKQGHGSFKIEDFYPWVFHPSAAKKVIIHYTTESGKQPKEVDIKWTESNGELDEVNHIYPDDIERVYFRKDEEMFWV